MTLDEYIAGAGHTDESFGERIGRSRKQVFQYRHGLAIPRKDAMERILKETKGQVTAASFYQ